jgi:hypothetical protein
MSTEKQTRRKVAEKFGQYQKILPSYPALLGNGRGTVIVSGRPGFVYVRVGSDLVPGQALNQRVPNRNNLPVIVGYDPLQPELFQVLSIREVYLDTDDVVTSGLIPQIAPHHGTHEWSGWGDDTVYVHLRQWLPLLVRPTSGLEVQIDQGVIYRDGWIWVSSQTLDLSGYRPTAASAALYVLVSLDETGVATATSGSETTKAALAITDCPAPNPNHVALAAVRMYTGQSSIIDYGADYDIVDLRYPQVDSARSEAALLARRLAVLEAEFDKLISHHLVEGR